MKSTNVGQHVFVSYSRANRSFVDRLIPDLQARGIKVWIDKQGLKPGTPNWEQTLGGAIGASTAILLVATPDSRKSAYVGDELGIAEMYQRPVYPVWASGDQWPDSIRMGYGSIQFIDARGDHYTEALREIVSLLGNPVPASPRPMVVDFEPRNPYKRCLSGCWRR
jgi:hypothetical protein